MRECNIHDCGNGYPVVGDLLQDEDGDLWQVVEICGGIYTWDAGSARLRVKVKFANMWDGRTLPFNARLEFV